MSRVDRAWPWWRRAVTGLSALGLGLSTYLSWHYLRGGSMVGCGGGRACDEVLNTRWSSLFGVLPVSGLAMGTYTAMLAAGFFIGRDTPPSARKLAWRVMLILGGAATGSAIWFILVQVWIVRTFCPYCMAAHITGLLLAALVLWHSVRQSEMEPAGGGTVAEKFAMAVAARRVVDQWMATGLMFVGLTLSAILVACQVAYTPQTYYGGGKLQDAPTAFDIHGVPLVGPPDAQYVVTLLFDYNCPHCQQLHFMLDEAVRHYHKHLAFVLCPAPLNTKCNPYVPRDVDEFKNSCELAKVGLAVWIAQRDAFPTFDGWMFSVESGDHWQPRSVEAARAKAVQLVGAEKFNAAQADPWIDKYLQSCVGIYGATMHGERGSAVPKFVFGSRWVIPQPNDANDMVSILHDSLGVPVPAQGAK
jgi:uncharacterized membrane protein